MRQPTTVPDNTLYALMIILEMTSCAYACKVPCKSEKCSNKGINTAMYHVLFMLLKWIMLFELTTTCISQDDIDSGDADQ